ncbi:hypothetical protein LXL04_011258 [Taraxacum kok-saghyz]
MEEQTIVYGYNNNPNEPEETETILLKNQSKSTTKRYKGVWRKNGRWAARIRNPITNLRVNLGKFHSSNAAVTAYFTKKREFESQIRDAKVTNSVMIDTHGLPNTFLQSYLSVFVVMPKRSTNNLDKIFTDPRIWHSKRAFTAM